MALALLSALGTLRLVTGAEFEFASMGLLVVAAVGWVCGRTAGVLAAVASALVWLVGDIAAERQYSEAWVPWANAATRVVAHGAIACMADFARALLVAERRRAVTDELTGLYNRRALYELGSQELDRARRYHYSVALVFVDLDNFKQLNDRAGHASGDAALAAAGAALLATARSTDLSARIGGDEFVVLLADVSSEAAEYAARRLSAELRLALQDYAGLTASFGVAWFPRPEGSISALLSIADRLMLSAKQIGHGAIVIESAGGAAPGRRVVHRAT